MSAEPCPDDLAALCGISRVGQDLGEGNRTIASHLTIIGGTFLVVRPDEKRLMLSSG